MILRLYRSSEPLALAGLPILAGALYASWFYTPTTSAEPGMPLFELVRWASGNSASVGGIFSLLTIVITAFTLVNFLNRNEFSQRNTFLPGLIYVFIASGAVIVQGLQPIIFANLFLLLAWRRLSSAYGLHTAYGQTFDAGIFIGLAALFWWPSALALIFIWMTLSSQRTFIWREWALPLVGFIVPAMFAAVWHLWQGSLAEQFDLFVPATPSVAPVFSSFSVIEWSYYGLFGLFTLFGIAHFLNRLGSSVMRAKKMQQSFLALTGACILAFLLSIFYPAPYRIAILALPLTMFFHYFLFRAKWRWLANIFFYGWLCLSAFEFYLYLTTSD